MGAVVYGVPHLLGVAMVGGDDERSAAGKRRIDDPADAFIDDFDGLDGGVQLAGVADHIGVGEVDDDERLAIGRGEAAEHGIAHAGGAHLGFLVVGGDVLGAGEDRKSTRLNSSHSQISYAVFCLKKKNIINTSCHKYTLN